RVERARPRPAGLVELGVVALLPGAADDRAFGVVGPQPVLGVLLEDRAVTLDVPRRVARRRELRELLECDLVVAERRVGLADGGEERGELRGAGGVALRSALLDDGERAGVAVLDPGDDEVADPRVVREGAVLREDAIEDVL